MLDATATALRPVQWWGSWAPRECEEIASVAALAAVQRLLLTTDGTVTTALATIAGEPVAVALLRQDAVTIADDDEELALWAGAKVLERRVLLHGADSGTPLLYGCSRIVAHRLAREARDDLVAGEIAIGLVLRAHAIETFRAPLRIGVLPATDAAAAHLGRGLMCSRRYAIHASGRPLMIVDEQFPADGLGAQR